jgi:N-acetylmuramoyl-L-alanine amidase
MKLITRAEWGARPPTRTTPLSTPVREIWIHHGAGSSSDPVAQWRGYQRLHMDTRKWSDIAYNFGIGRGGEVLEGRGPSNVGGGTGSPQDQRSYSVCFIGNFETEQPTQQALDACSALLAGLIDEGLLTRDFQIYGDRDKNSTACPGRNLYPRLQQIRTTALTITDAEDDDMSLTVRNLRTGHEAFRTGEAWAVRFVQQVLALPAIGTYSGPVDGQRSAALNDAIGRAKAILPGATGTGPAMGADLWRELVRVAGGFPAETAIVPADCAKVEAERDACRAMAARQAAMIAAARDALG